MGYFLALLATFVAVTSLHHGCTTVSAHRFEVPGVGRVSCKGTHVAACGLSLVGCSAGAPGGAERELSCLQGATYHGAGRWGPSVPADYGPQPE